MVLGSMPLRFSNSPRNGSTSQNRPEVTPLRIEEFVRFVIEVMSATEPEASAAFIFSSLEASGTHWISKS